MAVLTPQQQQQPDPQPTTRQESPVADQDQLRILESASQLLGQAAGWEAATRALTAVPHPAAKIAGGVAGALAGGTVVQNLVTEDIQKSLDDNLIPAALSAMLPTAVVGVKSLRAMKGKAAEPMLPSLSVNELESLTAKALQREGESESAALGRVRKLVGGILSSTAKTGGATFNPTRGNLAGQPMYAVGAHSDRTKQVSHELTARDLLDFIYRNSDLLANEEKSVGVWKNPQTGRYELDITHTASTLDDAMKVARQNMELAIWSLKDAKEIPVTLELVHYGNTKAISEVSPFYYGTGHPGKEQARILHEGAPLRSFYYIKHTHPESMLPTDNKYVTQVPMKRIYDVARDREGIVARAQDDKTAWEKELRERGYLGYINREAETSAGRRSVVLFEDYPVVSADHAADFNPTQIMLELSNAKTREAAMPKLHDLSAMLFSTSTQPFQSWKRTMADWVPNDLWSTLSPSDIRALYTSAKTKVAEQVAQRTPQSLQRLLKLHEENSPYIEWGNHILPVLRSWVGERAPLMAAALGATKTEAGYSIPNAITVFLETQTAPSTSALSTALAKTGVSDPRPFIEFHKQISQQQLSTTAIARQFGMILERLSVDSSVSVPAQRGLAGMTSTLASRSGRPTTDVRDVLDDASANLSSWEQSAARKSLWATLQRIAERRWTTWKEKYNVPDLGIKSVHAKLGLLAVLSNAALAGRDSQRNSRSAIKDALKADGVTVSPMTMSLLVRELSTWN